MEQPKYDILLTFKEAMEFLRVKRATIYHLMESGQLTGYKVRGTWRFYREDVRACVIRSAVLTSAQSEDLFKTLEANA